MSCIWPECRRIDNIRFILKNGIRSNGLNYETDMDIFFIWFRGIFPQILFKAGILCSFSEFWGKKLSQNCESTRVWILKNSHFWNETLASGFAQRISFLRIDFFFLRIFQKSVKNRNKKVRKLTLTSELSKYLILESHFFSKFSLITEFCFSSEFWGRKTSK